MFSFVSSFSLFSLSATEDRTSLLPSSHRGTVLGTFCRGPVPFSTYFRHLSFVTERHHRPLPILSLLTSPNRNVKMDERRVKIAYLNPSDTSFYHHDGRGTTTLDGESPEALRPHSMVIRQITEGSPGSSSELRV